MQKNVAVFFGGNSNEHEISIITGMLAVNLLRGEYNVLPVYLPRTGGAVTGKMRAVGDFRSPSPKWLPLRFVSGGLRAEKGRRRFPVDAALNCCHGGPGEDGTLSALLKWYRIKSASPEMPVSSVFMDKSLSKAAARGLGIPVLEGVTLFEGEERDLSSIPLPAIVKPAKLGSSIGIKVARSHEELERALALAYRLDDCALVEPYLEHKRDLNCAVCRLNGETVLSEVEEVFSDDDILSFSEKYEGTGARRSALPADIPPAVSEQVRRFTRTVYESFHGKGVMRADFLLNGEEVFFNELNTVPGSLACYLFGSSLTDAKRFFCALVEECLRAPESSKETVSTGILNGSVFSGKGGKRA